MPLNVKEGYDNLQSHNASLMEGSDLEAADLEFRCDGGDQAPAELGKGSSLDAPGAWQPSHPDKAKKLVFWLMSVSVCVEIVLLLLKLALGVGDTEEKFEIDSLNYFVAIARNCLLLYYIPRIPEHLEQSGHFSKSWLLREAVCGASSGLLVELLLAASLGISLEMVALVHGNTDITVSIWMYTMQCIDFFVLFILVLQMEQAWAHIDVICAWQKGLQAFFMFYDIVLHILVMTKSGVNHDFRDFRLASLASLIALRLICFRFFAFKGLEPDKSFVSPLHQNIKTA